MNYKYFGKNKTQEKLFFKIILNKYSVNEELNEDDSYSVIELLKRHPDFNDSILDNNGVFVKNTKFNTKCFKIRQNNDVFKEFSYITAINGVYPNSLNTFKEACRYAIKEDILELKEKFCINKDIKSYDVHHNNISFNTLVLKFIKKYNIIVKDVKYLHSPRRFVNNKLINNFKLFHERNADIGVLLRSEHKLKHKKGDL